MSTNTVKLCDIEKCEELARHTMLVFVHGEQKSDEDSFGAWVFPRETDLCGVHEYKYRKALPEMRLKEELSEKEFRMDKHQNPYTETA